MKYAIGQMMKQEPLASGERGWVVNIASIGGQVGLAQERESHAIYLPFLTTSNQTHLTNPIMKPRTVLAKLR